MFCKTHNDGELPQQGEIFVFGSNLAGRHGKGAAKVARAQYGAVYGVGEGLTGRAYAIPTKDVYIKTLPLFSIKAYIREFVLFAQEHPEMTFFLTRVGCGLAGYTDEQIAPLFKGVGENVSVPEEWVKWL